MKTLADAIYEGICSRALDESDVDAATAAALDWMKEMIPSKLPLGDDLTGSRADYDKGWNACRSYFLKRIKEERG